MNRPLTLLAALGAAMSLGAMNHNLAWPWGNPARCSSPQTPLFAFYNRANATMMFDTGDEIAICCQAAVRTGSGLSWTLARSQVAKPFLSGEAEDLPANLFVIRVPTKDLTPGFYDLRVKLEGLGSATLDLFPKKNRDGTTGVQSVPPTGICTFGWRADAMPVADYRPADFVSFWRKAYADYRANVPLDARVESAETVFDAGAVEEYNVTNACLPRCFDPKGVTCDEVVSYKVSWAGPDGGRVSAWLARPKAEGRYPAMVVLPGAGMNPRPRPLDHARHGYVAIDVHVHGRDCERPDRSRGAGYRENGEPIRFPLEETSWYGVYLRAARAVDYLASLPFVDPARIVTVGGSQGGRLSVVVPALEPRVAATVPSIAHGGNVPYLEWAQRMNGNLFKRNPQGHWGYYPEASLEKGDGRDLTGAPPVEASERMRSEAYFDIMNFAPEVTCPVLMNAGLVDPISFAPGVYATFLRLGSADKTFVPVAGHGHDWYAAFDRLAYRWIDERLAPPPASAEPVVRPSTGPSVSEPYLFTDETAEVSGLADGPCDYVLTFVDGADGRKTCVTGSVTVTEGRARIEPEGEGLHEAVFAGVRKPVRFLAMTPPADVDATMLRKELPRAAEKILAGRECRLLFLGDSVTATGDYGHILARLLSRGAKNPRITDAKRAHSGCSIDASVRDFMKEAGETKPDVVFTMYGLNDSAAHMSRAIFVRQLAWLKEHAERDFGAESFFMTPTPDHADPAYIVRAFAQAVADAAEALGVPYADGFAAIGTNAFAQAYCYPPSYSAQFQTRADILPKGDRIHPNALGHLRLARAAYARLAGPARRLKTYVLGETATLESECGRRVHFRVTETDDAYEVEVFGDGPYDGDVFTVFFDPRAKRELNTVGKYYWKDLRGREGVNVLKTTVPFSTWGGRRPDDEIGFQFTWRRRSREGTDARGTLPWFAWEREWTPCGYGRLLRRRDFTRDAAFMERYAQAAVAMAQKKVREENDFRAKLGCRLPIRPRLSSGLPHIFVWDAAFCCLWAKDAPADAELPVEGTLDNLYLLQREDGFICRQYNPDGAAVWSDGHPTAYNPPILAWAELELFKAGVTDRTRMARVYPKLVRFHDCYRRNLRRTDGLYAGDSLGGGMDDIPRWPVGTLRRRLAEGGVAFERRHVVAPDVGRIWEWMSWILPEHGWNFQAGWIDMSAQMAFDALNLAEMADALGLPDAARAHRAEHAEIAAAVNAKCWDEQAGFYFDCGPDGLVRRWHVGAFWTLIARIAPPEWARRLVARLDDPETFGRPVPVPSLAANDPDYRPETAYWCGAVWPPTTYMTIVGLKACGFDAEAERIGRRWYNANAALFEKTGTVFENISPEQCERPKSAAGRDFCGWGALAPVSLPRLFGWK